MPTTTTGHPMGSTAGRPTTCFLFVEASSRMRVRRFADDENVAPFHRGFIEAGRRFPRGRRPRVARRHRGLRRAVEQPRRRAMERRVRLLDPVRERPELTVWATLSSTECRGVGPGGRGVHGRPGGRRRSPRRPRRRERRNVSARPCSCAAAPARPTTSGGSARPSSRTCPSGGTCTTIPASSSRSPRATSCVGGRPRSRRPAGRCPTRFAKAEGRA